MTEHAAPTATWHHSQPRRMRSAVVDDHGRSDVPRPPAIDQTHLLDTASDGDGLTEVEGHRRALRFVGLYTASALAGVAATVALAAGLHQTSNVSPTTTAVLAGLVFVATTSVVLWRVMRSWADRLTAAAEIERRAAESISEVARIRAAFLDGISHELRTPLTNILGFAQTIRSHHRTLDPEHIEQFSDRLAVNTTRLERLVVDLLDLHRDGMTADGEVASVHVEQLLRAAVAATGVRSHRVHVWSPAQWVAIERDKLERIVAELVGNVVRHTPPDTEAWLHATTHGGELHLGIEDDGPGVAPGIIEQVSQPFVQGDAARDSPSPGLGIGLALAARYAEQLGGELTIERPAGGGTRVEVVLPYEQVATTHTV